MCCTTNGQKELGRRKMYDRRRSGIGKLYHQKMRDRNKPIFHQLATECNCG
ncbi:hypothetical protein [Acetohalobium arabaticum]|uniref:Uncharacterized protein n=1 Tax=Acetohalobium arabaticum (strain ATCC 49924 / DSM 5501 / Z-7288) TaxID=574087 RepID=D9QS46_ACEAZ|nr:hypothetical protein [Acetohalobium arabaticum]ADL13337.1 hypothetical protein Acear_1833 [Acetohalobium arabaticum DSM 5501]